MRFLCTHSLPPGSLKPEQVRQVAEAMQKDPQVHGIRSFGNLTEGKIACVVEAPDKQTLASWYQKMMMPYDTIVPIEFEGDRGNIRQEVVPQAVHAHA